MYPALDLPIGESEWTQWQRHWKLQRASETNVSSGRDIQTVTKQQKFRLLTLALESWSQQKTMQEFSVTKHNGEKPQEGKGYFSWSDRCKESRLVTRTALCRLFPPMSRSPTHVTTFPVNQLSSSFIIFSSLTCPVLPNVSEIYIIIEASWNANLFQLLLVLFQLIFTITMEERNRHFN